MGCAQVDFTLHHVVKEAAWLKQTIDGEKQKEAFDKKQCTKTWEARLDFLERVVEIIAATGLQLDLCEPEDARYVKPLERALEARLERIACTLIKGAEATFTAPDVHQFGDCNVDKSIISSYPNAYVEFDGKLPDRVCAIRYHFKNVGLAGRGSEDELAGRLELRVGSRWGTTVDSATATGGSTVVHNQHDPETQFEDHDAVAISFMNEALVDLAKVSFHCSPVADNPEWLVNAMLELKELHDEAQDERAAAEPPVGYMPPLPADSQLTPWRILDKERERTPFPSDLSVQHHRQQRARENSHGREDREIFLVRMVKLMVEHGGACPNSSFGGWYPLRIALDLGNIELVQTMLDFGAELTDSSSIPEMIDELSGGECSTERTNFLMSSIKMLVEHGAPVERIGSEEQADTLRKALVLPHCEKFSKALARASSQGSARALSQVLHELGDLASLAQMFDLVPIAHEAAVQHEGNSVNKLQHARIEFLADVGVELIEQWGVPQDFEVAGKPLLTFVFENHLLRIGVLMVQQATDDMRPQLDALLPASILKALEFKHNTGEHDFYNGMVGAIGQYYIDKKIEIKIPDSFDLLDKAIHTGNSKVATVLVQLRSEASGAAFSKTLLENLSALPKLETLQREVWEQLILKVVLTDPEFDVNATIPEEDSHSFLELLIIGHEATLCAHAVAFHGGNLLKYNPKHNETPFDLMLAQLSHLTDAEEEGTLDKFTNFEMFQKQLLYFVEADPKSLEKIMIKMPDNPVSHLLMQLVVESEVYSNFTNEEKLQLFFSAVQHGTVKIVKTLLDQGSSVTQPYKGRTPLEAACQTGNQSIARYLIHRNADPRVFGSNYNNSAGPLHNACLVGDYHLARFLVEKEAVSDELENTNETLLHLVLVGWEEQKVRTARDTLSGG